MSLDRFISAQEVSYSQALLELRDGHKTSHWMWYIFPQLAGLGHSAMARRYAIVDLHEARQYASHPSLGYRLAECTEAVVRWAPRRDLPLIFGSVDAMKFKSSMTLFEAAGAPSCGAALDAFGHGERDRRTLELLGMSPGTARQEG